MNDTFLSRVGGFLKRQARAIRMARKGNIALIFALTAVPVLITGSAGIDLARALAVRAKMYAAVDAAALAVASKSGLTQTQAETLAKQYFNANYTLNTSFGAPAVPTVAINGQEVTVSSNVAMPTTLMGLAGIQNVNLSAASKVVWGQTKIWVGLALDNTGSMAQGDLNGSKLDALKLAVNGKTVNGVKTDGLLDVLKNASATPGDVKLALIPFSLTVNVGAGNSGATWIDWTDYEETNGSCTPALSWPTSNTRTNCQSSSAGTCSISGNNTQSSCTSAGTCTVGGFTTQANCTNSSTGGVCSISSYTTKTTCQGAGSCSISAFTSQSTCTDSSTGGVCNNSANVTKSACQSSNGYCSVGNFATSSACTNNSTGGVCSKTQYTTKSTCTGANPKGTWTAGAWTSRTGSWTAGGWTSAGATWTAGVWNTGQWTPSTWTPSHAGWNGCIEDRGLTSGPSSPAFDVSNAVPSTTPQSKFSAASGSCPAQIQALGYDWDALKTSVSNLNATGSTNQTIGLAWAWQSLTNTLPMNSGALPANTTRFIIILSDGENTKNRWNGDGQNQSTAVDDRMKLACDAAKADGVIIYSVFVNIAGTAGDADSMKKCATGYNPALPVATQSPSHYVPVTSTGGIEAAFSMIGQQITNLRVAH